MKLLQIIIGITLMLTTNNATAADNNAYDFSFDPLVGPAVINLADYKDKVILIVNTASKCGFTGQYDDLEKLYQEYKDDGLVIIGVPSNDFGAQEQGTNGEIAKFCELNFGVSFIMTAKYSVKSDNSHPFYKWAKTTLGFGTAPKWNFHKYLIDKEGKLVDYFLSTTNPTSNKIKSKIEELLRS